MVNQTDIIRKAILASALLVAALTGCASEYKQPLPPPASQPIADGLVLPTFVAVLDAYAVPPLGWTLDNEGGDDRSHHRTWVSPTGKTAYGVVFFKLPIPVGHELALEYGFLPEMKKNAGEANLIAKQWDEQIEGLRFEVEGGPYYLRTSFFVRGLQGWAIYAGTRRDQPIEPAELKLAEVAREKTVVNAKTE